MRTRRTSVPAIRTTKASAGGPRLAMMTAYDEPTARLVDAGGVDLILVGDSVGNVVLGHEDTLRVTVDDMVHHTAAVAAARPAALIIGDLPWLSYHVTVEEAVRSAAALVRAGADAVKLEGGVNRLGVIGAIIDAEIPVMGHLGLTPQSVRAFGGFKVQGRSADAADVIRQDAAALEEAGCFAVVLEGVPDGLGAAITLERSIPTIGIGAGPATDGQVLVFHDAMGLGAGTPPKFVRQYLDGATLLTGAVAAFVADVRSGGFPGPAESYVTSEDLRSHLKG